MPKGARELSSPANMGVASLVAISGRYYRHMSEREDGFMVPDPEMRYGAFLHLVLYDGGTNGQNMRLEIAGEINTKENGDFTIDFAGNLQLQNNTPQILEVDRTAAIQGSLIVHYNSAEKHFFGYAKVVLYKPGTICAEGSLLVDVKPGKWRVALGSREERLIFVPGCAGWSPTGWLDINQNVAELGVGLQFSVKGGTPALPIAAWMVRFTVDAGLAFGVLAAVQYRPDFKLIKAGVWADLWATINMDYRLAVKKNWKSVTLVDILLKGDLILYFVPKPTMLEGSLRGYVKVLFFKKNINASMSKEI